ncbi:MAG: phosphate signaling complex protein PhoU [Anaerolineales bacterium]|nr:phosphate signaling complex protein PhoU [Anaerolineales bacterium]
MTRGAFRQEMQEVKNEILLLGSMVEDAVMKSVSALRDNDPEHSRLIILNDKVINRKSYEIEIYIVMLMATQQPAARDLRTLASSLGICTELERVGDYAKGIANLNIRSGGLGFPKMMRDIYVMGEKAVDMLHRAMTTFADEDFQSASDIIPQDDLIDECYTRLYQDAVNSVLENAGNIERANYVIWAAHNLERLGDRATNICERVMYMVTGNIPEAFIVTGQLKLPNESQ